MDFSGKCGHETFVVDLELRWSDEDSLGHVNHVKVVDLLQEARIRWLGQTAPRKGFADFEAPRVVVSLAVDYARPLYGNAPVQIAMHVTRIGTKSYTVAYRVSQNSVEAVVASTILVTLDASGTARFVTPAEADYLRPFLAAAEKGEGT
ncbi:acyl-CoA thioesterase [Specibacter sp. RAF43]|uniref:acyl-CoA thioesterase n=1 Tax=Specibacter sp. RAF43 TaxID=3233057 RepID=UPI003F9D7D5A